MSPTQLLRSAILRKTAAKSRWRGTRGAAPPRTQPAGGTGGSADTGISMAKSEFGTAPGGWRDFAKGWALPATAAGAGYVSADYAGMDTVPALGMGLAAGWGTGRGQQMRVFGGYTKPMIKELRGLRQDIIAGKRDPGTTWSREYTNPVNQSPTTLNVRPGSREEAVHQIDNHLNTLLGQQSATRQKGVGGFAIPTGLAAAGSLGLQFGDEAINLLETTGGAVDRVGAAAQDLVGSSDREAVAAAQQRIPQLEQEQSAAREAMASAPPGSSEHAEAKSRFDQARRGLRDARRVVGGKFGETTDLLLQQLADISGMAESTVGDLTSDVREVSSQLTGSVSQISQDASRISQRLAGTADPARQAAIEEQMSELRVKQDQATAALERIRTDGNLSPEEISQASTQYLTQVNQARREVFELEKELYGPLDALSSAIQDTTSTSSSALEGVRATVNRIGSAADSVPVISGSFSDFSRSVDNLTEASGKGLTQLGSAAERIVDYASSPTARNIAITAAGAAAVGLGYLIWRDLRRLRNAESRDDEEAPRRRGRPPLRVA